MKEIYFCVTRNSENNFRKKPVRGEIKIFLQLNGGAIFVHNVLVPICISGFF